MADYYGGYGHRQEKMKRRSFIGQLVDILVMILMVIVGITFLLTYIAPCVNPASSWIFSILGLAAPGTYLAVLLLALYWIVRWRWGMASVMLVLVFAGLFKVSLFYKADFRKVYDEQVQAERGMLKFMTYNVRLFYNDQGDSSASDVFELVEQVDPDVLCLQEFNPALFEGTPVYEALLQQYDYAVGGRSDEPLTAQMALFSKYRILNWGSLAVSDCEDWSHNSVWADLAVADDTVRIFSNHLHSTAINAADNEFITKHQYISDTAREDRIRSIVKRLRDNSIVRAAEVDSIALHIAETPYAHIVCGDFNDTPMSYVYRRMSRGLKDAFRECGKGYSYTYRGFFNMLRIDYVLSSEEFEPVTYEVLPVDYSDHLPVIVRLRYTPRH